MTLRDVVKIILQTIFTTVSVMAILILLLGFLPDYSSFDSETTIPREINSPLLFPSFLQQNLVFWSNAFFRDFGVSRIHTEYTVGEILRRDGIISGYLFLSGLLATGLGGAVLGFLSGYYYRSSWRKGVEFFGLLVTAAPSFFLIPILVYIFSIRWSLLPSALWEGPSSLVLPLISLTLRPLFLLARVFSHQLLLTAEADFVVTAKAKGLSRFSIWIRHILPNSLGAAMVLFGNYFGQFITGSFLVETLFGLPGIGSLFIRALAERDYPVLLSLCLIFTLILQLGHRLSDLLILRWGANSQMSNELVI